MLRRQAELGAEKVTRADDAHGLALVVDDHEAVELGVSPRGSLAIYRTSQALAALRGRTYVIPSDVQHLAPPLLTHRIHISPQTRLRGRTPQEVVAQIVSEVPTPVDA